jgi:hypothetical protein
MKNKVIIGLFTLFSTVCSATETYDDGTVQVTEHATLNGTVHDMACEGNINDAAVYFYGAETPEYGDLGSDYAPYTFTTIDVDTATNEGKFEVSYLPLGTYDLVLVCNAHEDDLARDSDILMIDDNVIENLLLSSTSRTVSF